MYRTEKCPDNKKCPDNLKTCCGRRCDKVFQALSNPVIVQGPEWNSAHRRMLADKNERNVRLRMRRGRGKVKAENCPVICFWMIRAREDREIPLYRN